MTFIAEFISEADKERYRLDSYIPEARENNWVIDRERGCFLRYLDRDSSRFRCRRIRKTLRILVVLLSGSIAKRDAGSGLEKHGSSKRNMLSVRRIGIDDGLAYRLYLPQGKTI